MIFHIQLPVKEQINYFLLGINIGTILFTRTKQELLHNSKIK